MSPLRRLVAVVFLAVMGFLLAFAATGAAATAASAAGSSTAAPAERCC